MEILQCFWSIKGLVLFISYENVKGFLLESKNSVFNFYDFAYYAFLMGFSLLSQSMFNLCQ